MGMYKEIDHKLAEWERRQRQIYPDAADSGIRVENHKSKLCREVADMLNDPFFIGNLRKHRDMIQAPRLYKTVTITIFIPWEEAEGYPGYSCTRWQIHFTNDYRRKLSFLSFTPRRMNATAKEIWNDEK